MQRGSVAGGKEEEHIKQLIIAVRFGQDADSMSSLKKLSYIRTAPSDDEMKWH